MTQVNILSGVYTNLSSDFRVSYPRNLAPVPMQTGTSNSYLRPAEGIITFGFGPGIDRGGINWRGQCYRVMGADFVLINMDGTYTPLGNVGFGSRVTMDYSFDALSIAAGGRAFFYKNGVLYGQPDADFGNVLDMIFLDGYFVFTDGEHIGVTELNNPFIVNPIKYGSSEIDPDPIVKLLVLRNELQAVNRYSIEAFENIGGDLFPFRRIEGAQVQRGCIGKDCCAIFLENIAFLGGGRNEAPAVWLGSNGSSINISTREVDQILRKFTESELAFSVLEVRVKDAQKLLYLRLPDQTLVYDAAASKVLNEPIWYTLTSSLTGLGNYRAGNFVYCYDKWLCGDTQSATHGFLSDTVSSHYGEITGWEFSTLLIYNEGNPVIFNSIELVCLTGRVAVGINPSVWTSYSTDGLSWSQEKVRSLGKFGETNRRITWFRQGFMRNWRIQRFRGTSDSLLTISRLEMKLEPLNG